MPGEHSEEQDMSALTLTELSVVGDDLAVAAEAVAGVGAKRVDTAALPSTRALLTLVHVCMDTRGTGGGGQVLTGSLDRPSTLRLCTAG